jgi:hypothetical protein
MLTISVKLLTVLTDKISVDPILYSLSAKIYFPVEFKVISKIFLFIF